MVWTIEAKVLPLAGISGHLYIDIFDDRGIRVCQINGLATHPTTLQPRSIGMPGDLLKAYVGNLILTPEDSTRDRHPHQGRVLFRGNREDIVTAIRAAQKAEAQVNALNLPYRVMSLNSNSVFMHMVEALSAVVAIDQQAVNEMRRIRPILPGIQGKIADHFHDAARKDIPPQPPKKQPPPPQPPQP